MKLTVRRYIPIVVLALAVTISGGTLMMVSQNVYHSQQNIQKLSDQILTAEWEIKALNAEIAYLTRPDRMEQLSLAMVKSISPEKGGGVSIAPVNFLFPEHDLSISPSRKPNFIRQASASVDRSDRESRREVKVDFSSMLTKIGGRE